MEKNKENTDIKKGSCLVMSGFIIAVAGIVGYCVICFSASVDQGFGTMMHNQPHWPVIASLGVIGLGTLCWIIGSFMYLNAAVKSDYDDIDV